MRNICATLPWPGLAHLPVYMFRSIGLKSQGGAVLRRYQHTGNATADIHTWTGTQLAPAFALLFYSGRALLFLSFASSPTVPSPHPHLTASLARPLARTFYPHTNAMFSKLWLAIALCALVVVPTYALPLPQGADSVTLVAWAPDAVDITGGAEYTAIGTTLGGVLVEGLATYTYTNSAGAQVAIATVTGKAKSVSLAPRPEKILTTLFFASPRL